MRSALFVVIVVIMAALLPVSLSAQSPLTGSISGVVRNTGGVPVSGVRVTAMPADSNDNRLRSISSLTLTDSSGRYTLENVPAGRYFISAGNIDSPTFYPATLDMTKATAVSITSSMPKVDFNITLQGASAGIATPEGRRRGLQLQRPTPAPFPQQATRGANQPRLTRDRLVLQSGAAWWTNAPLIRRLDITEDQKKKIEAVFEQHRTTLIQNKADLEKEEGTLARMLESEPLESAKTISAQIDRVVQTRADMERTNSLMTLEMRQVLTRTQWMELQSAVPQQLIIQPAPQRPLQLQVAPRPAAPAP